MEPPALPAGPAAPVRAAPGASADLLLPPPSGTKPFTYHWSRAGASLDERFTTSDDAGGVRLTVSAAQTGDSGVYTLQASNAAGSATSKIRLEVSAEETPTGEDPPTFLRRLQDLTVKVGSRTRFLVEIISSTECKLTWYRNERRLLEAERVALARDGNFWCADVAAVSVDDAGRWTCTAENAGGRASCSAHLNVLVPKAYKRPEFVEELRALLTEQGTVSLECKVVGVPTPVLRWFKDSREIKAGDVFALTANAEDPTSLGTYTCEAVNCMGRAYSSSKVHVVGRTSREGSARPTSGGMTPEPPPIFTKELEDAHVKVCEPLTLGCHVVVPPWPRSVVWYNKEGKVEPGERYHTIEDGVGGYLLEMSSAEWADEGEWKCVATSAGGRVGITTCYVAMDVPKNYRKPRFMENLQAVLTEEGLVSFECKVVGFPTPILSWFKDGQELKPGDVYQLTGTNSLGSYCCIAKNCMGQASSSAELTVEDIQNQLNEEEKLQLFSKNQAPKFLQGLKSVEAKIDEPFRFVVKVAIPPEPSVLWYRDDQPVDESTRCHLDKEEKGIFNLDIQNLEFLDQAEWKCVAMNDFGHSVTSCFLKLIIPRHYKKPRFLENLQAILSDEGAVNLECKVIGVPQPVLKWYKDGEELKPGDIHRIISGQDGTCCLGTYTCEAQNCMGIAASSASLLGFDDSMKTKTKAKEEQPLQRNLSLSTIHEERTSQMYDTPVGDITLDDKGEISFSFDGKEVSVSLYETPDLTEEEALQIVEMYADQLSENVTEHNVVELPPLRFVKETSTSGNLLMEAIIIDVSPDYFATPEEDLRTEADVEDLSIADENGLPQLSLDQDIEIGGEDYFEKTMALKSEERSDFAAKSSRRKSDSQRSADDFFSLSRDQSLSEEKRDDDTHVSESELQSFASARSSAKVKSKSSKKSGEDGQELSEPTKTVLTKDEIAPKSSKIEQTKQQEQELDVPVIKPKRERRTSRGSRRSSTSSEKSIGKSREELLRLKLDLEQPSSKPSMSDEEFKTTMNSISTSLTTVINDVQLIERDIILKSELMSSAATASRSLEIISSLITPLSEIHSIAEAAKESVSESRDVTSTIFNSIPQPLKTLQQSLTIIEKCIDMESDNKTLVKKTCVAFIETCGIEVQKILTDIISVTAKNYIKSEDKVVNEIDSVASEMTTVIKFSAETINTRNILSEASEIKPEIPTLETKHLKETQKAIFELKSPLNSLLRIVESAQSGDIIDLPKIKHSEVIMNDMSASIQDLQTALEQIETLSVKETSSTLHRYNTDIIENVMDSVIKLRGSFEQLSTEPNTEENKTILKETLSSLKENLVEISNKIETTDKIVGKFDILQSENKLDVLQKMAQILIALENNLPRLEALPTVKSHMDAFHKNLTKVLENVIESNVAEKYQTMLEICDTVNIINASIRDLDSEIVLPLASLSNTLKIIQANLIDNIIESELNCAIMNNISDVLVDIQEAINKAEDNSLHIDSEYIQDLSSQIFNEEKINIILEHIDQTIAAVNTVKTIESIEELKLTLTPALENVCPILEELRKSVASVRPSGVEQDERISEMTEALFAQTIATPLCELNQSIIVFNQLLADNIDYIKENTEVNTAIAEPLHELHTTLEILQQDVISQYGEDLTPYDVSINMASVVQNLQSCIVMIQEQAGIEGAEDMSTLEDISGIKTSADTLPSDRLVLPTAEETAIEQSYLPLKQEVATTATAQTLQTLNEHILVLQTPDVIEALDTLSEISDYASLKSVIVDLGDLHSGIEGILHPVPIEGSIDFDDTTNITKLAAIAEPMHEIQQSLSVLDTSNIPVFENILDLPSDKIHSVFRSISELKDSLEQCMCAVIPAMEIANNTIEISNKVSTLREVCEQLKEIFETSKDAPNEMALPQEMQCLEAVVNDLIDATNVSNELKIEQVKSITEELYFKVMDVQEDFVQFTVLSPEQISQEAKLIQIVNDVEKNIAVLEQYDFIDLSRASDLTTCMSPQLAAEVDSESLAQITDIAENAVNILQDSYQEIPSADLKIVEDFFKTCKNEFTILRCLITKPTSHKKIIRLLQEFSSLQTLINNFTNNRLELCLSDDVNECLTNFLIHADECLRNARNSLIKVVDSQSDMLIKIPFGQLGSLKELKGVMENETGTEIVNVIETLLQVAGISNHFENNLHCGIIEELSKPNQTLKPNQEETLLAEKIEELAMIVNAQTETNNLDASSLKVFEELKQCICKHNYKDAIGTGKTLIIIKCLAECAAIVKEKRDTSQKVSVKEATEIKDHENSLKEVLTEMLQPLQALQTELENIREQVLSGAEEGSISIDVTATESIMHTMTELHKDILQQIETDHSTFQNEDIPLLQEVDKEIHTIKDSIRTIDNVQAIQAVKEITKPVEDIEKSLLAVLQVEKVSMEKEALSKDINANVTSLENTLDSFIEIKTDIAVISELLKTDIIESVELAIELKKIINATKFNDEKTTSEVIGVDKEIFPKLKKVLSKLDLVNIETYLEGKNAIEVDKINRVFQVICQLIAELDCTKNNINFTNELVTEESAELRGHIDQYIEIFEIIEEITAVIKLEDIAETLETAHELKRSISLNEEIDNKETLIRARAEQTRLAQKLQTAISALQVQVLDSAQELVPTLNSDALKQIVQVTAQLQEHLVAVTSLETYAQTSLSSFIKTKSAETANQLSIPSSALESGAVEKTEIKSSKQTKSDILETSPGDMKVEKSVELEQQSSFKLTSSDPTQELTETETSRTINAEVISDLGVSEAIKELSSMESSVIAKTMAEDDILRAKIDESQKDRILVEKSTTEDILLQHITEYVSEDIIEVIDSLASVADVEDIQISINIANELRECIAALEIDTKEEYASEIKKPEKQQIQLIRSLESSLSTLSEQTLENLQEFVPSDNKASIKKIAVLIENLKADIKSVRIYQHDVLQDKQICDTAVETTQQLNENVPETKPIIEDSVRAVASTSDVIKVLIQESTEAKQSESVVQESLTKQSEPNLEILDATPKKLQEEAKVTSPDQKTTKSVELSQPQLSVKESSSDKLIILKDTSETTAQVVSAGVTDVKETVVVSELPIQDLSTELAILDSATSEQASSKNEYITDLSIDEVPASSATVATSLSQLVSLQLEQQPTEALLNVAEETLLQTLNLLLSDNILHTLCQLKKKMEKFGQAAQIARELKQFLITSEIESSDELVNKVKEEFDRTKLTQLQQDLISIHVQLLENYSETSPSLDPKVQSAANVILKLSDKLSSTLATEILIKPQKVNSNLVKIQETQCKPVIEDVYAIDHNEVEVLDSHIVSSNQGETTKKHKDHSTTDVLDEFVDCSSDNDSLLKHKRSTEIDIPAFMETTKLFEEFFDSPTLAEEMRSAELPLPATEVQEVTILECAKNVETGIIVEVKMNDSLSTAIIDVINVTDATETKNNATYSNEIAERQITFDESCSNQEYFILDDVTVFSKAGPSLQEVTKDLLNKPKNTNSESSFEPTECFSIIDTDNESFQTLHELDDKVDTSSDLLTASIVKAEIQEIKEDLFKVAPEHIQSTSACVNSQFISTNEATDLNKYEDICDVTEVVSSEIEQASHELAISENIHKVEAVEVMNDSIYTQEVAAITLEEPLVVSPLKRDEVNVKGTPLDQSSVVHETIAQFNEFESDLMWIPAITDTACVKEVSNISIQNDVQELEKTLKLFSVEKTPSNLDQQIINESNTTKEADMQTTPTDEAVNVCVIPTVKTDNVQNIETSTFSEDFLSAEPLTSILTIQEDLLRACIDELKPNLPTGEVEPVNTIIINDLINFTVADEVNVNEFTETRLEECFSNSVVEFENPLCENTSAEVASLNQDNVTEETLFLNQNTATDKFRVDYILEIPSQEIDNVPSLVHIERCNLIEHIDAFITEEVADIVNEISVITNSEILKESMFMAKKLRESVIATDYSATAEEISPLEKKNISEHANLAQKLQDALSTWQTQALDNAEVIAPLLSIEAHRKVSEIVAHLQDDLNIAIVSDAAQNTKLGEISVVVKIEELNSITQLEQLLKDVNMKINPTENTTDADESESLRDALDEVQTVIIKLKSEYDGATNDTLNETLEDLECSVRSVQLQINEESPPELLNEACVTLQVLVQNMNAAQQVQHSQNLPKSETTENILDKCSKDTEESVNLLDLASKLDVKDCTNLTSIINSLKTIRDSLKTLRESFLVDADTVIENGVKIIECLNQVEENIFSLEKDVETAENITVDSRDSIITAIHSVYGSISNMRGTVSSVQKRFMFENFGRPSESLLHSIKNISVISSTDDESNKASWKKFSKSLRKVLNHFEDIKFYINLDKTARLPSDAAFTKIILDELKDNILSVLIPRAMLLDSTVLQRVNNSLKCVENKLANIESEPTLQVKSKIPMFRDIAADMLSITTLIKNELTSTMNKTEKTDLDIKVSSSDEFSDIKEQQKLAIKLEKQPDESKLILLEEEKPTDGSYKSEQGFDTDDTKIVQETAIVESWVEAQTSSDGVLELKSIDNLKATQNSSANVVLSTTIEEEHNASAQSSTMHKQEPGTSIQGLKQPIDDTQSEEVAGSLIPNQNQISEDKIPSRNDQDDKIEVQSKIKAEQDIKDEHEEYKDTTDLEFAQGSDRAASSSVLPTKEETTDVGKLDIKIALKEGDAVEAFQEAEKSDAVAETEQYARATKDSKDVVIVEKEKNEAKSKNEKQDAENAKIKQKEEEALSQNQKSELEKVTQEQDAAEKAKQDSVLQYNEEESSVLQVKVVDEKEKLEHDATKNEEQNAKQDAELEKLEEEATVDEKTQQDVVQKEKETCVLKEKEEEHVKHERDSAEKTEQDAISRDQKEMSESRRENQNQGAEEKVKQDAKQEQKDEEVRTHTKKVEEEISKQDAVEYREQTAKQNAELEQKVEKLHIQKKKSEEDENIKEELDAAETLKQKDEQAVVFKQKEKERVEVKQDVVETSKQHAKQVSELKLKEQAVTLEEKSGGEKQTQEQNTSKRAELKQDAEHEQTDREALVKEENCDSKKTDDIVEQTVDEFQQKQEDGCLQNKKEEDEKSEDKDKEDAELKQQVEKPSNLKDKTGAEKVEQERDAADKALHEDEQQQNKEKLPEQDEIAKMINVTQEQEAAALLKQDDEQQKEKTSIQQDTTEEEKYKQDKNATEALLNAEIKLKQEEGACDQKKQAEAETLIQNQDAAEKAKGAEFKQVEEDVRIHKDEEARALKEKEDAELKQKEEARAQKEQAEAENLRQEQDAAEKAKKDAELKQKEDARIRKEEEARLFKEKEDADLKQQEEEARFKKEKAEKAKKETEKKQKEEEEARVLKEKADAELKREEEARAQKELAEAEALRQKQDAAEKAKHDADIKQKEEETRLQKEDRVLKEKEDAELQQKEEARAQKEQAEAEALRLEQYAAKKDTELKQTEEYARIQKEEARLLKENENSDLKQQKEEARIEKEEAEVERLRQEQDTAEKAKKDAELKQKEDARIQKEEEARLLKEKEDADLKQQEEKARIKKEKAKKEAEKKQKEEEEARVFKEKADAELKREEEARAQKEQAEAEALRQKQDAAEKAKHDADIKQKEEETRLQKEEARVLKELRQEQDAAEKAKKDAELKQKEEEVQVLKEKEDAKLKQKEEARIQKEKAKAAKNEAENKQTEEEGAHAVREKADAELEHKEEACAQKEQAEAEALRQEQDATEKVNQDAELKEKEKDAHSLKEEEARLIKEKEDADLKQQEEEAQIKKEKAKKDKKEEEKARGLKEKADAERKRREEARAQKTQAEAEVLKQEQDAAEKAKQDADIKQTEENTRLQKEEAAQVLKEKEDAELKQKEEARAQKEQVEAERLRQEQDTAKKAKQDAELKQKQEEARLLKEKEDADLEQQEEKARIKKEKAKKSKNEAEKKQKEEEEARVLKEKADAELKREEEARAQKEQAEALRQKQDAAEKAKQDAVVKQKEEVARLQKEEEARVLKEKEDAELKQKEEARAQKEQAEAERLRQEQDATEKAKKDAELKQKQEARCLKEKEDADLKQQEEKARIKKEKAKKAKNEAEKKQKEEEEARVLKEKADAELKREEEARAQKEQAEALRQKQDAAEKAKQDAVVKQKEEVARLQKEEDARVLKEKEDAELKQKEEARAQKEQAEAERLRQEQDATKKAKKDAELKQKEEEARVLKEKEDAELKQKEETRITKEKAKKAKKETENKQKEEKEARALKEKADAEIKQKEEAIAQEEEAEAERLRQEQDAAEKAKKGKIKRKEENKASVIKEKADGDIKQKEEEPRILKEKEVVDLNRREEEALKKEKAKIGTAKKGADVKQKKEDSHTQIEDAEVEKLRQEKDDAEKAKQNLKNDALVLPGKENAGFKQKEEEERIKDEGRKRIKDSKKEVETFDGKRLKEEKGKKKETTGQDDKEITKRSRTDETSKKSIKYTERLGQSERRDEELHIYKEDRQNKKNGDISKSLLEESDGHHYIKEYQYEPSRANHKLEAREKPRFVDHNHRDYTMEFARPSGYRERSFDVDKSDSLTSHEYLGKNAAIYKAQTLILDSQLRSSTPLLLDTKTSRTSEPPERRSEIRPRSKAHSEARTITSEKRTAASRDSKRKPVFSTYLTDRTAVEGSRVKLTCSVLSSSETTVTWYKNGVLLDNKLKYRTKFIDGLITLEVLNAVPSDSAEYSCTIQNENGCISSSANLKVYPSFEASPIPPTFTRSIRDTYHLAENELVLECRIRGQPLPVITWLKDDKSTSNNSRYQAYYLADGVCRLAIEHPTPEDSGKYTCKAENSVWSDQITHVVNFTGKESRQGPNIATIEKSRFNRQAMESRRPHFTNVLSDYKVVTGGTIGLQVEIRGAPTRVEWLREGCSVTEVYRNAKTFVEQELYTLALSDVTEKESGLYTCRAWSSQCHVDMNAAITVVQPNELDGKPAIIVGRPEKDILISIGEDVNISFRVQGEPKPKVVFMKGIRDITTSQRVCKMTSDDYVKFTLKRSVVADAGTYCILARNAYGVDRAFVTVVVRQRASSDNLISDWTYPVDDSALSTAERKYKSVPERIPGEPCVVEGGNNWISLGWPKSEPGQSAPVLAYKVESWLLGKDGGARWSELGITPLNSFDAFNLKQGEEYHFRVTPRNRYGWGESVQTSSPISVGSAGDRPEFTESLPGQLKVLVGETANLTCSVKGTPAPEVIWMKNGHEIEDEDRRLSSSFNGCDCSLTIKDINIEDEARYSCEATNLHGRASTYARLAVVTDRSIWEADAKLKRERSAGVDGDYPPQFTMRLRDRRVQATYPVRLTCQVIGSPDPRITWFKDGMEVKLDNRRCHFQDEHFHTLEIAPTNLEDGGVYEAMARNSSGAVSCRCNLVVDKGIRAYVAPEFCCGLEPLYRLTDGEELRISAVVEAYPSVGVTWYRDGVRLRPCRRAIMTLDRDGQIELALAAVTSRDAGVYSCTASNEVGRASTSGKVEVIGSNVTRTPPVFISHDEPYSKEPMFIRKPRSSEAREGDTVIIACEVVGDPKPDVYWLRDFLKPDYYRDATHFKRMGDGPEYRFEIPHAKLDYTGAYSVVARNTHGEAKAIISLQILAKDPSSSDEHNIKYGRVEVLPRFSKELTDLLSCDGDAVEFECHLTGNPEPSVRWFHYQELIRDCPDFETSFDDGTARLKIKQVTAEDEGTYTCEAANNLGKTTSSACLVVYPPGEPNTLSQRLRRPPTFLSAASTPRSTPRSTPARSVSRTPGPETRRLCSPARTLAPSFYTYPFNKVVEEGDTVTLQCAIKGNPAPWATWDKDGVIITPSSRITIKEKDDVLRLLEIEQVTVDDVGVYRITIENEFGRQEASARIEVITQKGKFYAGVRAISPSPRKTLAYHNRRPSTPRQD